MLGIKLGFHSQALSIYRLCHPLSSTSDSLFPNTALLCLPHLRKQQLGPPVSGTPSLHLALAPPPLKCFRKSLGAFCPHCLQRILPPVPSFSHGHCYTWVTRYQLLPGTQRVLACSFPDSPSLTRQPSHSSQNQTSGHLYKVSRTLLHIQDAGPSWDPQPDPFSAISSSLFPCLGCSIMLPCPLPTQRWLLPLPAVPTTWFLFSRLCLASCHFQQTRRRATCSSMTWVCALLVPPRACHLLPFSLDWELHVSR